MILLLLLTTFMLRAAHGQQSETIANADASITNAVPEYQARAERYWGGPGGMIDFFEVVNAARSAAALNTSSLFPSLADAFSILTILGQPTCEYSTNVTFYFTNDTAAQAFICCHLSVLNAPGWDDILAQLQQYFFRPRYTVDSFTSDVVDQLLNVANLRMIELESINIRACKDDVRIHDAETIQLRARLIGQILGVILRIYNFIASRTTAIQACTVYPMNMTGCLTNTGPALFVDIFPNMMFVNCDFFFQGICGGQALAAFNTYALNKASC